MTIWGGRGTRGKCHEKSGRSRDPFPNHAHCDGDDDSRWNQSADDQNSEDKDGKVKKD